MLLFPNAKINLGLSVTEKRPDGYHNLLTVFYPIGLSDILEFVEDPEAPKGADASDNYRHTGGWRSCE